LKRLQGIFLVVGLILFGYLVSRVGPGTLLQQLLDAGWGFGAVVATALASIVVMGVGWKILLDQGKSRAGLVELVGASIVGAAINFLTPGSMGGEPVKASLLGDKVPSEELVSTVLLHNLLYWLANLLLIVLGFFLALATLHLPLRLVLILGGATMLVAVPVLLGAWIIHRGSAEGFLKLVRRIGITFHNLDHVMEKARQADRLVRRFRAKHPGPFWWAFAWVFVGRALSVLEVWVILWVMGHQVSFPTAFLVQATSLIVYVAFAFIPSQLGANEGASFMLFPFLGLSASVGLAMEVIRRLRVVALVLLGLGLLALFTVRRPAKKPGSVGLATPE